ncbi:hypothetical protein LTR37_001762 [Vermiconidia calcicola]|uniref:Uncharacterized protein n=1 Tax=Vermiconidia calcicola TaxID=1690605 RepID=A0ACC3NV54_9PEZI|nr:hypothetical protein LTR37_001762 [Vermiconidia calcicola]
MAGRASSFVTLTVYVVTSLSLVSAQPPFSNLGQAQCSGELTIEGGQSINDRLLDCDRFIGNIVITHTEPPPWDPSSCSISLPATLREIDGSLKFIDVFGFNKTGCTISLSSLQKVGGGLTFKDLKDIEMPEMSMLETVEAIKFDNVTINTAGSTVFGVQSMGNLLSSPSISFTTCSGLTAIGPMSDSYFVTAPFATIAAVNNQDLASIDLRGYTDTQTDVIIQSNAATMSVSLDIVNASMNLDQIETFNANALQYLMASGVAGAENVSRITNSLLETLEFPSLESIIETTLMIDSNYRLSSLSLPNLEQISALEIADNTALKTDAASNVNVRVTLPQLNDGGVDGQVHITSTQDIDCSSIDLSKDHYSCKSDSATASAADGSVSSDGSGSATSIPSSGGGMSSSAKIGLGVGLGVGIPLLLAGALFLWFRSRKSKQRSPRTAAAGEYSMHEQKRTDRSPSGYAKVPISTTTAEGQTPESQRPVSRELDNDWAPPGQAVPSTDGRVELEEQQRPRHEMDARSLPDLDIDDDAEETRSLQDIERSHAASS